MAGKPSLVLLVLDADVTPLTLAGGSEGQTLVLVVQQGVGGTWTPAPNMLAHPVPAPTAGGRDVFTFAFDGEFWNETGRVLNLTPPTS